MRIGILGGAFDPIHIGHLIAAQAAYEQAQLDEVWFMPSNVPPLKAQQPYFSAHDRFEMVKAAIGATAYFKADDLELKREHTSYTIDSVNELRARYPEHQFSWIIGADRINDLLHWKQIDQLARLITFIGLQRPGYELNLHELPGHIRARVNMVEMAPTDLSSTMIRSRIQENQSIRFLVPNAVIAYINGEKE